MFASADDQWVVQLIRGQNVLPNEPHDPPAVLNGADTDYLALTMLGTHVCHLINHTTH